MNRVLIWRAAICAAFVFSSAVASAQPPATPDEPSFDDLPTLPETVVNARRFPTEPLSADSVLSAGRVEASSRSVGSSVTIITEKQIHATGARSLDQVLRTVPGLNIAQSGGPGQTSGIFLRGTNSSQTKVLLDGIPLNDPTSPNRAFDPSKLQLDNIERIEVVRGAQSTIYGSDAIGGVVNIITKRGNGPMKSSTTAYGGSFGTYGQSVGVSGGDDKIYYSTSGSWLQTDGFSAASAGHEKDGYTIGTIGGRYGIIVSPELDLDYVWRYADAHVDFDDFDFATNAPGDANRRLKNETFQQRVQARYFQLDGDLEHRVGFSFNKVHRDDKTSIFSPKFFDGETRKVDYQTTLKLLTDQPLTNSLTAGVEHLDEETTQEGLGRVAQFDDALFVQSDWGLNEQWFVTAGYRHDDYSRAGAADTYRVTSRYIYDDAGSGLHGSYGTGFRAPALAENAIGFGFNPLLRPERSRGWDLGVEKRLFEGRLIVDATYFRNDLTDLINFDLNTFTLNNISTARTDGVELTSGFDLTETTRFTTSYTHQNTLNGDTGGPLLRRPRDLFNMRVSQMLLEERANVSFGGRYASTAVDFGSTGLTTLHDYIVLDTSGWYQATKHVRVFARLDNLTDEDYREVFGYSTSGIAYYIGATVEY